jgi:hypothetical protein
MRARTKALTVAGGYVVAFALAWGVVAIHMIATSGPVADAASGMYAFGDSLLFIGAFAVAAVPATAAALFFLRPYRPFWTVLSAAGVLIAATSLAAACEYAFQRSTSAGGLSILWLLIAPVFALLFLMSGIFAPNRSARVACFASTAIDVLAFASFAAVLFRARG